MQYVKKEIQAIFINCATRTVSRLILSQEKKTPSLDAIIGSDILKFRNITIGKTRYEMWHSCFATIENSDGAFRVVSPCGDVIVGNAILFPTCSKTAVQVGEIYDPKRKIDEIYNSVYFQKKQYNWQPLELDEEDGNPYWEKCHSARDLGAR